MVLESATLTVNFGSLGVIIWTVNTQDV